MKLQFHFAYVLSSVFLISQLALRVPAFAELKASLINSREIEERALAIIENIDKTALAILSISSFEQTFENTLRPWNRLSAQLSEDFDALKAFNDLDLPLNATAVQVSNQLHAYLLEVAQNPELNQTLSDCSLHVAQNLELDPFQRYIGTRFIQNNFDEPVYLSGIVEEQKDSRTDYTFLNLTSGSLTETQVKDLALKILLQNADAVCIQDVAADDDAYVFYDMLQRNYSHFIYTPPSPILRLSKNCRKSGMLIASKFGADELEILLVRSNRDRDDDKKAGGGWEIGVDIRYGGKDGPQIDGYLKGEAHDDRGNYAEGRFDHNFNRNEGNVSARGGNKDEDNK